MSVDLVEATDQLHLTFVRELFAEYAEALGIDLSFQGFDEELASLPGAYAPPAGRLLVALDGHTAAGCVALRPLGERACEMKRLYVRPAYRGTGLGRMLVLAIVAAGRELAYECMRLDTLPSMGAAIALYRSLGFEPIEPYRENPVADARFLERALVP